ncbi:MAG: hypothetical protein AB1791_17380, partial [Chloroflexota bacterium]
GYLAFQQHEKRDALYKVARFLIEHFWKEPAEIANGLGVLLLTWNQAFYRYGRFDFYRLEKCIVENYSLLDNFRQRDILSYSPTDDYHLTTLFHQFLDALQICEGSKLGARSPVGVAKALHLLASAFFPMWDYEIARAYNCSYMYDPANKYILFCRKMLQVATELRPHTTTQEPGKSLLKLIDEYNYAKYTKKWV